MKSIQHIMAIFKKEFLHLRRDKATIIMIIFMPLMQLFLFGFAINSDPHHLSTGVITHDQSIFSRNILYAMKNSRYFNITHNVSSLSEGKKLLKEGKINFLLTIPNQFYKKLISKQTPQILIEADATDPIAVARPLGVFEKIIQNAIEKDAKGTLQFLKPNPPPYSIVIHQLYNPENLSHYNFIPGLIGIVLMMTCITMTASSLTNEKEKGTMENLLSMPIQPIEVMLGKVTPYIFIAFLQAFIILSMAYFVFGLPLHGSFFLIFLSLFLFISCKVSLGYIISVISKNQTQSNQMSTFFMLPSILLSGFMFPFSGMPGWAQFLGSLLPTTYFMRLMRSIILKGCSFIEMFSFIWPLCLMLIIIIFLSVKIYKRTLD